MKPCPGCGAPSTGMPLRWMCWSWTKSTGRFVDKCAGGKLRRLEAFVDEVRFVRDTIVDRLDFDPEWYQIDAALKRLDEGR